MRWYLSLILVLAMLLVPVAALAEDPPPDETPVTEETPVVEETPIADEIPAVEETPVTEEIPAVEETPADEESVPVEEAPVVEQSPSTGDTVEGPALLFSEDFTTNSKRWNTTPKDNLRMFLQDGQYHMAVGKNDRIAQEVWSVLPGGKTFGDFVLQVEAAQVSGPDRNNYGVVFRHKDGNNYYKVVVSPIGAYRLYKYVDGTFIDIAGWTRSPAINLGTAVNVIKIAAKGHKFTLYVNGVELGTYTDTSLASGKIDLMAGTWNTNKAQAATNEGTEVAFDNLQVWEAK